MNLDLKGPCQCYFGKPSCWQTQPLQCGYRLCCMRTRHCVFYWSATTAHAHWLCSGLHRPHGHPAKGFREGSCTTPTRWGRGNHGSKICARKRTCQPSMVHYGMD